MSPRYWLEFRVKKVALFLAALGLIVAFWWIMPAEVQQELFRYRGRRIANLPFLMFLAWLSGWFLILFVRAEDLQVMNPSDIQSWCRAAGALLILASLLIAGFFSMALLV
jgi:hypothetical protein